jgi:hypothetical protein
MDHRRVLELNGELLRALPNSSDRETLLRRIGTFLGDRHRRGKLRLPAHFPREVRQICELRKPQLASFAYWVSPGTSLKQPLPKWLFGRIARNFPGMIWNSTSNVLAHMANSLGVHRMNKTSWPGVSRTRWPSTPSASELLAMSRLGLVTHGLDRARMVVSNHITSERVSDDIRLATRIVRANIVGIRATVGVPEEFFRYFRRRHGFLILTVRYKIPAGLTRFLIASWIRVPFNLWLVENCRFKNFLKRHSPTEYIRDEEDFPGAGLPDRLDPLGLGRSPSESSEDSSIDSLAEEMLQEFPELL